MARKTIIIIITTILIFMLVFFPSSVALASTARYGIKVVSMSSSSSFTYTDLTVYNTFQEAQANSSGYVFHSMDDSQVDYENFILLKGVQFSNSADYSYTRLYVTYNEVERSVDEINYIQFDFSYFVTPDVTYPSMVLYKADTNTLIPETDYTIAFVMSGEVTPIPPNSVPADLTYKACQVRVLFNKNIDLSGGLRVGVNQYVLNYYNTTSSQIYGFSSLHVDYTSTEEFLSDISEKLDTVGTDIKILTDLQSDNNQILSTIYDELNTPLSEEQQQKLAAQDDMIADIRTEEALTEEKILELKKYYLEDYSYDFFGNDFNQQIDDYVEPLFSHDGFSSFWFGLWSQKYIVAMFVIVVSFCWMGFIFYGTR